MNFTLQSALSIQCELFWFVASNMLLNHLPFLGILFSFFIFHCMLHFPKGSIQMFLHSLFSFYVFFFHRFFFPIYRWKCCVHWIQEIRSILLKRNTIYGITIQSIQLIRNYYSHDKFKLRIDSFPFNGYWNVIVVYKWVKNEYFLFLTLFPSINTITRLNMDAKLALRIKAKMENWNGNRDLNSKINLIEYAYCRTQIYLNENIVAFFFFFLLLLLT